MVAELELNDGSRIPAIGFGLYKVEPAATHDVVDAALHAGYTLIDGAAYYGNEAELGAAVRASGRREALQITSKFWGEPVQSFDQAIADFTATQRALDLGKLDIYMIHWPRPSLGAFVDTWRALIELRDRQLVTTIGVANFNEHELQRLIDETGVVPAINQVESHPWLPQHELRAFHREHGIVTQAWSPLGRGRLLEDPTLIELAAEHGVSVAQIVLRWHLQLGGGAVPKSTHAARLLENIELDGFTLSDADLASIAGLESGRRTGTDPKDRR